MQMNQVRAFPLKDWEVRAVNANKKVEKRIPIKPQPKFREGETGIPELMDDGSWQFRVQPYSHIWDYPAYPRHQKGDLLYVQEAWGTCDGDHFLYRADYPDGAASYDFDGNRCDLPRWKASTQMPREAARTFLRVVDVRLEKLRSISDEGCAAEGILVWTKDGKLSKYCPADSEGDYPACGWQECPKTPQLAMQHVWDKPLKGRDLALYGWDANPWVWVYAFEKVSRDALKPWMKSKNLCKEDQYGQH